MKIISQYSLVALESCEDLEEKTNNEIIVIELVPNNLHQYSNVVYGHSVQQEFLNGFRSWTKFAWEECIVCDRGWTTFELICITQHNVFAVLILCLLYLVQFMKWKRA
jgi:hypothetical protein